MIDLSKKYTSNGCPVLGLVQLGDWIGGWVQQEEGRCHAWCWKLDGSSYQHSRYSLKEHVGPVTVERWITVFEDGSMGCHKSKHEAVMFATERTVACVPVKITYTPGEGLQDIQD